jgi:serine/threonine protein kinase
MPRRRCVGMIGEVFGNYRITAKLGEGGMGEVYLAEHPNIGRKVAVKMIRPAFSNDAETLRRFVREARSTATLRHPALVDIMDYGVHEKTGSAYIIMEYLEGESLDARLEREGALPPRRAAEIARQIAFGMAAAHRAGIIHRDLKPGNVHLIADPDRPGVDIVKVLDFGIAKLATNDTGAGPTTRSDMLLGTPRYMAPEQCRGGGAFDHRVDIYSLGCLLYEALSGRPPFIYQWPGELIAAHLGEIPPPVRALVPVLPEGLESIVMRAIAKHPDHRQPTMSHVAGELERFLELDVSVPPVAVGSSVVPAAAGGSAPPPVRPSDRAVHGGAPTTTASVVMRQRGQVLADGAALPRPTDSPLAQTPHPHRAEPSHHAFLPRPILRRALIGAATLVAGGGLIVAIATKESSNSRSPAANSAELAPATPPSGAARSLDEPPRPAPEPSAAPLPNAAPEGPAPPTDEPSDEPGANVSASATGSRAPAPPLPTATETAGSGVRIKVTNPRPGLRVTVDGRPTSLPVRLPRDQKAHVLAFTAPNFKVETKTVVADQDHSLTLEYRPKLYVP